MAQDDYPVRERIERLPRARSTSRSRSTNRENRDSSDQLSRRVLKIVGAKEPHLKRGRFNEDTEQEAVSVRNAVLKRPL
jgi:hypothetical protein